jgi:hypothetical protein
MPGMDRRRALLWLLLVALLLGPIAGATIVPDPTWIAGVYDDGDGDEVAILWDHTPAVVPVASAPLTPASRLLSSAPVRPAFVSRPLPRFTSRAPPQA